MMLSPVSPLCNLSAAARPGDISNTAPSPGGTTMPWLSVMGSSPVLDFVAGHLSRAAARRRGFVGKTGEPTLPPSEAAERAHPGAHLPRETPGLARPDLAGAQTLPNPLQRLLHSGCIMQLGDSGAEAFGRIAPAGRRQCPRE